MIRHSVIPVVAAIVLSGCASTAIYDQNDLHFILPCKTDTAACMTKMEQSCAQVKGQVMSRNVVQEELPVVQVICRPPAKKKPQAE
ncbi:hypothetical protein [Advenella sp. FME57]|uniref:hypothetical protein n=1 Tax=Advenella sp. FME57 TaxID=2742604 RepID=UPI001868C722|nr:hypothetical protein [Advenella sp. FME57]